MLIPFSDTFVEPFVVGVLLVIKLELVEVTALESELDFKKLNGDEAGALDVLNPANPPNALLVEL